MLTSKQCKKNVMRASQLCEIAQLKNTSTGNVWILFTQFGLHETSCSVTSHPIAARDKWSDMNVHVCVCVCVCAH